MLGSVAWILAEPAHLYCSLMPMLMCVLHVCARAVHPDPARQQEPAHLYCSLMLMLMCVLYVCAHAVHPDPARQQERASPGGRLGSRQDPAPQNSGGALVRQPRVPGEPVSLLGGSITLPDGGVHHMCRLGGSITCAG